MVSGRDGGYGLDDFGHRASKTQRQAVGFGNMVHNYDVMIYAAQSTSLKAVHSLVVIFLSTAHEI